MAYDDEQATTKQGRVDTPTSRRESPHRSGAQRSRGHFGSDVGVNRGGSNCAITVVVLFFNEPAKQY